MHSTLGSCPTNIEHRSIDTVREDQHIWLLVLWHTQASPSRTMQENVRLSIIVF